MANIHTLGTTLETYLNINAKDFMHIDYRINPNPFRLQSVINAY